MNVIQGGQECVVNTKPLSLLNWQAVCFTPITEFFNINAYFRFVTIALLAGLVVVGVILSCVGAYRVYTPIRTVRDEVVRLSPGDTDLWRHDELKHIQASISAIEQTHNDYKTRSHEYSRQFITHGLANLLDGRGAVNDEALNDMAKKGIGFYLPTLFACQCRTAFFS